MPIVAEPQPTRMRCSGTPSMTGAVPELHDHRGAALDPSSTACRWQSASIVSQVTTPSFFEPPVRWRTPPSESIWRAVFRRGDMADLLAAGAHRRALGAEMPVGVDLHLQAAIAKMPSETTVTMSTPSIWRRR